MKTFPIRAGAIGMAQITNIFIDKQLHFTPSGKGYPNYLLFNIGKLFSRRDRLMSERQEGLMDGRLDNVLRTMNVAFYQLDEALKKILGKELEFDILRYDKAAE